MTKDQLPKNVVLKDDYGKDVKAYLKGGEKYRVTMQVSRNQQRLPPMEDRMMPGMGLHGQPVYHGGAHYHNDMGRGLGGQPPIHRNQLGGGFQPNGMGQPYRGNNYYNPN